MLSVEALFKGGWQYGNPINWSLYRPQPGRAPHVKKANQFLRKR
jgi:hypothetical protein